MSDKIKQALQWLVDSVEREFPEACSGALVCPLDAAYAALASLDAQPEAEQSDEWRRLALQFDGHRMQALAHLKAMLADPAKHAGAADAFLNAGPLSGEQVLAERIAALVAAPVQPASKPEAIAEMLEGYADSYMRMSRMGDGNVQAYCVATDIRQNMIKQVLALTRCDTSKEASDAPKQAEPTLPEIAALHNSYEAGYIAAKLEFGGFAHPAAQPCQSISDAEILNIADRFYQPIDNGKFFDELGFARAVRGEPAKTGEAG